MQEDRRIKIRLFLFFLGIYLLSAGNHFKDPYYTIDEKSMILTTHSMLTDFDLELPEMHGMTASKHGILPSILAVPFFLAGELARAFLFPNQGHFVSLYAVYSMNAFITALLLALFFTFSRYLGYPRKTCFYTTLILGLGTIVFPFAGFFFSSPLSCLTLLASLYHLVKYEREKRGRDLFFSGVWLGLLLLTRIDGVALLPVFALGIFLAFIPRRKSSIINRQSKVVHVLLFCLALAGAVAIHFFVEYLKYGTAFHSGYGKESFTTPLGYGLFGLLFSSGRSLFLYSPPVILCLFGLTGFWRRHRFAAAVLIFTILLRLLLFSRWWGWHGGLSWGPRYLNPLVPLFLLFLNEVLVRYERYHVGIRTAILIIFLVGFLIQVTGVLASPALITSNLYGLARGDEAAYLFIPQMSGLSHGIQLLRAGCIDSFLVSFPRRFGLPFFLILLGFLGVLIVLPILQLGKRLDLSPRDLFPKRPQPGVNRTSRIVVITILANLVLYAFVWLGCLFYRIPRETTITGKGGGVRTEYSSDAIILLDESTGEENQGSEIEEEKIEWSGFLHLPLEGEYRFTLLSRGRYRWRIGGRVIMEKNQVHKGTGDIRGRFEGGWYDFHLEYRPEEPGRGYCIACATFPGFGVYKSPLSNRNVFARKPGFVARMWLALDRYKTFLTLFTIMLAFAARAWLRPGIVKGDN